MDYNYKRLEKNISDMIYEGIMKIGYMEKQRISVYYDIGLLSYLLEVDRLTKEQWRQCLKGFKEYAAPRFGELIVKRLKDRFEFNVSEQGVAYIYENNGSRQFLQNLIYVLEQEQVSLEQVVAVFNEVSDDIIVEHMEHDEFQHVISFSDKSIDEFKYCFAFDEMGHYYHRLLEYDFEKALACQHG